MNYLFIVNKLTELNILSSNNISLHTKFTCIQIKFTNNIFRFQIMYSDYKR